MTTKLFSFLGTTDYQTVVYCFGGGEYQTRYAPAALCRLLKPDELLVFATKEAEAKHRASLEAEVGNCLPMKLVSIPAGTCEEEMWDIFRLLTDQVGEGDKLYFDITHGYRSLPFLSFLALAYVRTIRHAEVAGVYYGAYEARQNDRAPVFNLTPFVELLNWTVAADRFIRFGDARDLAELAGAQKREWARAKQVDTRELYAWGKLVDGLHRVSLALRLIRPREAMEAAYDLRRHIAEEFMGKPREAHIVPLYSLLQAVSQAFEPIALKVPHVEDLGRQRNLIRWYADHEQYVQAMALAREWMVSWAMLCQGMADIYSREQRGRAEERLNVWARQTSGREHASDKPALPPQVLQLWEQISERRNDLLHAGMRTQAIESEKLRKDIVHLVKELEKLPLPGEGPCLGS